jgi:hypothetical protein
MKFYPIIFRPRLINKIDSRCLVSSVAKCPSKTARRSRCRRPGRSASPCRGSSVPMCLASSASRCPGSPARACRPRWRSRSAATSPGSSVPRWERDQMSVNTKHKFCVVRHKYKPINLCRMTQNLVVRHKICSSCKYPFFSNVLFNLSLVRVGVY